jgi:hypothetical protein
MHASKNWCDEESEKILTFGDNLNKARLCCFRFIWSLLPPVQFEFHIPKVSTERGRASSYVLLVPGCRRTTAVIIDDGFCASRTVCRFLWWVGQNLALFQWSGAAGVDTTVHLPLLFGLRWWSSQSQQDWPNDTWLVACMTWTRPAGGIQARVARLVLCNLVLFVLVW